MNSMPRDGYFDSTYQLLSNPYGYIGDRCTELGTDVFETRILLERTVCMMGARAAQIFYDSQRFQRQGAAPEPLRATLFGKGAVQSLDGAAHQHRKALFMHLLGPGRIASLAMGRVVLALDTLQYRGAVRSRSRGTGTSRVSLGRRTGGRQGIITTHR